MKLHHLRLRGIGPFRGDVDLDLAALGASGLFLIEGPTGSGKSTILDSLVYALYGTVAGAEASGDRIRSQFSPPEEPSVVDLVFETSSGIYRVRREPEYERPKRRGTGLTQEHAKAILWRIGSPELIPALLADAPGDGAGIEPLATRLDEVGREITRAIGLSRAQFTQTVLLPQGEFARFLRARTGERQQVLQRVFGTELYEDVEKRLEVMRRESASQVQSAREELGRAVSRFLEAAGLEEEDPRRADLEEHAATLRSEELLALTRAVTEDSAAMAAASEEAARTQREQTAASRAAAEAARLVLARIDRRRELDALGAEITQKAPEIESAERRRIADEQARPVAQSLSRRDAARTHAAARAEEFAALRTELEVSEAELVALAAAPGALETLEARIQQATTRAGALAADVELEEGLPRRSRELEERTTRLAGAQKTLDDLDAARADRPEQRIRLLAQRAAAREHAARLPDLRLSLQTAEQRRDHSRSAAALAAAVATALGKAEDSLKEAQRAAEAESALRRRRHEGLAAELAMTLDTGEACPVCGGTEHPHPAEAAADHVDAQTVDRAEEERRRTEQAAAAAKQAHAVAAADHATALELAGGLEVEAAETARAEAAEQLETARAQQELVATLESTIEAHDAQDRRLTAQREQDALALATEATSLREAVTALAGDRLRVDAARGTWESVAEHRDALAATSRAARQLREARLAADQAAQRAKELAAEVEIGVFTDEAAVLAAVLDPADRKQLDQLVHRHAVTTARLADGLAEEGIAEVDPGDVARTGAEQAVAATTAAVTAAEDAGSLADATAGRQRAVATASAAARERLATRIASVREVSEGAAAVVRVADLATGRSSDGDRIQLSTYVLMRRFEDVIAAANTRLALFSGSDLELVRDPGARGARKTGLDLQVIDRRTDSSRVPETLSGGETFLVSLALALGLADIVTAEAGGIQLETLFIDEGFGSLDPESLDRVVAEIGQLAASGRTIGLVSHVGDMKQQITEQIRVRRGADGSSGATVIA